ncbi:MAG TPA: CDP-diacylglycerol--glycerol-3-phosphate 3-phosphatidyltransferase, partial [Hyphomonadaceae bacterium]|nr:CDP-diacylglycerol--glycerol-3-phosphate 3-phosphatidyltransferase [Hyphomonadaceae bacterium]
PPAPSPQGEGVMNLPTLLTLFRIAMGPAIAALVLWAAQVTYSDRLLAGMLYAASLMLFLLAAATDWLDGWLARKLNAVTPLGAALDHTADKVLIACVLLVLAYAALPLNLVAASVIILGRDVAIAGLREGAAALGKALPVAMLGKWKAAAEMAGVAAFLAFQAAALLGYSADVVLGLKRAALILLWMAAALALASAAGYVAALLSPDDRTQAH